MKLLVLLLVLSLPGLAAADTWWVNRGDSYQFVYTYPAWGKGNPYPETVYEPRPVWTDNGSNPEPSEGEARGEWTEGEDNE